MLEHKRRWNSWTLSVWNCFWKKKAEQFLLLLLFSLCVCVCALCVRLCCVCVCVWCVRLCCVCAFVCCDLCVCIMCVCVVCWSRYIDVFLPSFSIIPRSENSGDSFQNVTPPQLGNHSPLTYSFYLFSTTKQNQMISEDFQALNLFLFTDHSSRRPLHVGCSAAEQFPKTIPNIKIWRANTGTQYELTWHNYFRVWFIVPEVLIKRLFFYCSRCFFWLGCRSSSHYLSELLWYRCEVWKRLFIYGHWTSLLWTLADLWWTHSKWQHLTRLYSALASLRDRFNKSVVVWQLILNAWQDHSEIYGFVFLLIKHFLWNLKPTYQPFRILRLSVKKVDSKRCYSWHFEL